MSKRNLEHQSFKCCDCSQLDENFQPVQPNLSLTPKDVRQLTERGISVSTQNLGIVTDTDTPSDYLPLEHQRGTDLNTAWEASYRAKEKLMSNYRYSKRMSNKSQ